MLQLPLYVSNDNSLPQAAQLEPLAGHASQSRLRIDALVRETIYADLPEVLLDWLHDGSGTSTESDAAKHRLQLRHFETAIVERLFPVHDHRTFMVRLREHSRATAMAARTVAEHAALGRLDTAFIAGWLHDMGIAAQLGPLDPTLYPDENEAFSRIWPEILRSSAGRAVSLASHWRLPSAIRHTLREHLNFGTIRPLQGVAASTFVAEHLAGCMGYGFRDEQPTTGLRVALSMLKLSERDLVPMGRRAERHLGREAWHWVGS